jgi:hypothetical protein
VARLDPKVHGTGWHQPVVAAAVVGMRQVENMGTVVVDNGNVIALNVSVRIAGWAVGNPNHGPGSRVGVCQWPVMTGW